MATAFRNTGTRFRYDDDDHTWHARMRVQSIDTDGEKFLTFVTRVATLLELLAWIADVLNGMVASEAGAVVKGHPAAIEVKEVST